MQLNEICEFIVDCPHSTAPDEGDGYPLIRTPNVGRGRLLLEGVHRVSERVYKDRTQRGIPQDGDIIFAREAPAGNAALVTNGAKVCLGQRTVLIRPNQEIVNPEFLVYYLLAPEQQYKLLGTANGATVAHVNLPVIRNLPVELPERDIQDKIAGIISTYDNLIENNQKQIKLLEEAAQRIYKEWFVDLHFPGYEDAVIVDGVPDGWHRTQLQEISKFARGKTITKKAVVEGDIPVVAGGLGPAYYHNKSITEAPVITVSGSGANAGFVRMYYQKIWASDCSYIDVKGTDYIYFTFCFLKDNKKSLDNLQKGAAQPHVYAKDINALNLICPTDEVLGQYEKAVLPIFSKIANCISVIEISQQARDRLLPKLMSGELEV